VSNIYQPIEAQIEDVIAETQNIKTFVLRPKERIEFEAGQFVEMTVPGVGEAPFTPSSSPYEKEKIEATVMKMGTVTSTLHDMKPGDTVGLRGPYGLGYPLDEFKGKEVLIIGMGVGLAPLRSLFLALVDDVDAYDKVILCYGARTPSDIVYKQQVVEVWPNLNDKIDVRLTVDAGDNTWEGKVGFAMNLLDDLDLSVENGVAIVCGPVVGMRFTTVKLWDVGYADKDIYLSMERNMSCGIGKCGHCQLGKFYVCKDGPVFTWDKIKDISIPEEAWA
jgi:NAD(P)H-flavin reductase